MSAWLAHALTVIAFLLGCIAYMRSLDRYEHLRKRAPRAISHLPPNIGQPAKWRREHN